MRILLWYNCYWSRKKCTDVKEIVQGRIWLSDCSNTNPRVCGSFLLNDGLSSLLIKVEDCKAFSRNDPLPALLCGERLQTELVLREFVYTVVTVKVSSICQAVPHRGAWDNCFLFYSRARRMYVVYVGKCLWFDSISCMHFISTHILAGELLMSQIISKANHDSF